MDSAQIIEANPAAIKILNHNPLEMRMPAKMRERLEKRMDEATFNKTDRKQKQERALEQKTDIVIAKIIKAQTHNQQVRAIRLQKMDCTFSDPQSVLEVDQDPYNKQVLKSLALKEAKMLNFERRQEKAALRRDQLMANKVQAAINAQSKHFVESQLREARRIKESANKQEKMQCQAEERRNNFQQQKLQKAKESQEKFFDQTVLSEKDRKSSLQPSQSWSIMDDQSGENVKQSHSLNSRVTKKEQAVAFFVPHDDAKLTKIKTKKDVVEQQKMKKEENSGGAHGEQEKKALMNNISVGLPLNIDMQVKKNAQEKQSMEIKEQQTMIVGGNKLTFSINITVQVEPIE